MQSASHINHRSVFVAALAATLLAAGNAAAKPVDLRSADAKDAAAQAQTRAQDLRRLEAGNTIRMPSGSAQRALDQERYYTSFRSQAATPVVSSGTVAAEGFDWTDAAVGAGGALLAVALMGGGGVALTHRRTGRHGARPAVS
jgi:hypothetical protein